MFKICIHYILFKLCLAKKKKMNKIESSCLVFSTMLKVSRTFSVHLALLIS